MVTFALKTIHIATEVNFQATANKSDTHNAHIRNICALMINASFKH